MLLLLHSPFMLSVVKVLLKGEVGGRALNSHGNYIIGRGKSWKNHGIVFLNFCGNPVGKGNRNLMCRPIWDLVVISYVSKISIKLHMQLSRGDKVLSFGMSLLSSSS